MKGSSCTQSKDRAPGPSCRGLFPSPMWPSLQPGTVSLHNLLPLSTEHSHQDLGAVLCARWWGRVLSQHLCTSPKKGWGA